jgi:hypothetical protein
MIAPLADGKTKSSGPTKCGRRLSRSSSRDTTSVSGTDRTRPDFGVFSASAAGADTGALRRTWMTPLPQSMSRQRKARSSPIRSPVCAATRMMVAYIAASARR